MNARCCAGIDLAAFPRPTGDAAEAAIAAPTPLFPANAHPRYLRLTCNAIPAQQVSHDPSTFTSAEIHGHPFCQCWDHSLCSSAQLWQMCCLAVTLCCGVAVMCLGGMIVMEGVNLGCNTTLYSAGSSLSLLAYNLVPSTYSPAVSTGEHQQSWR